MLIGVLVTVGALVLLRHFCSFLATISAALHSNSKYSWALTIKKVDLFSSDIFEGFNCDVHKNFVQICRLRFFTVGSYDSMFSFCSGQNERINDKNIFGAVAAFDILWII